MPSQETVERLSQEQREALLGLLPPQFKRRRMNNTISIVSPVVEQKPTFVNIQTGQMFKYKNGEKVYMKARVGMSDYAVSLVTGLAYQPSEYTEVELIHKINVS